MLEPGTGSEAAKELKETSSEKPNIVWRIGDNVVYSNGEIAENPMLKQMKKDVEKYQDEDPYEWGKDEWQQYIEYQEEQQKLFEKKYPVGSALDVANLVTPKDVDINTYLENSNRLTELNRQINELFRDLDRDDISQDRFYELYGHLAKQASELEDEMELFPDLVAGQEAQKILLENPTGTVVFASSQDGASPGDSIEKVIVTKHGDKLLKYEFKIHEYGMPASTTVRSLQDAIDDRKSRARR